MHLSKTMRKYTNNVSWAKKILYFIYIMQVSRDETEWKATFHISISISFTIMVYIINCRTRISKLRTENSRKTVCKIS